VSGFSPACAAESDCARCFSEPVMRSAGPSKHARTRQKRASDCPCTLSLAGFPLSGARDGAGSGLVGNLQSFPGAATRSWRPSLSRTPGASRTKPCAQAWRASRSLASEVGVPSESQPPRPPRPPRTPPPFPLARTNWTRLVLPSVLIGHVSSLLPY
jgi:hypothetical protein